MKKYLFFFCIFLIFTTLISCRDLSRPQAPAVDISTPPETAAEALAYMDAQLSAQKSYRADGTTEFILYTQGVRVRSEMENVTIEDVGERTSDYYSYSHADGTMQLGSQKYDVFTVEAYSEGVAYSSVAQNKKKRKLRAKMSLPAYIEYRNQEQALLDFDFANCQNANLEATEKGYLVTCSGYGEQALQDMADMTGIAALNGDVLQDMQVTFTLDQSYLPQNISLELIITSDNYYKEYPPYFRLELKFSEYNEAEHITRNIEPEDYTEVKDLRLLGELEQRILETLDQKKGGFTRELSHTITVDGQSSTDTVVDTVATFSNTDKGFSFKAELEDGDVGTKVTYGGGDLIGLPGIAGSKINRMSDEQAKQTLSVLINDPSYGYDTTRVTNIEKTRNGYLVTLVPSETSFPEQLEGSLGINLEQESETIEFVIKWGKITKIIHSFDSTGKFNGQEIQYSGTITVTFD